MINNPLQNKKVLITAGPTREAIDPVRFISNHSSGKMGYAIAESFLRQGADVTLVSGPVCLQLQHPRLVMEQVVSATDMYMCCCRYFAETDIVVFAAAVADYRPEKIVQQKIKKQGDFLDIRMVKNIDIAGEFGRIKTPRQVSVGFALETNNELANAMGKLQKKNFDMVVLNSMNDAKAGFGYDTNKVSIITETDGCKTFDLKPKKDVAEDIVAAMAQLLNNRADCISEHSVYEYENMYR